MPIAPTADPPPGPPSPAGPPGARSRGRWVREAALVLSVAALDLLFWGGARDTRWGWELPAWVIPVAVPAAVALLPLRGRRPLLVFGVQWALAVATLAVLSFPTFAGPIAALHGVAAATGTRVALAALPVATLPFAAHGVAIAVDPTAGWGTAVSRLLLVAGPFVAVAGLAWGLGRWSRARALDAARDERRRAREAERALAEQRLRLARELHDSVAGSTTAMILHAAGARARLAPAEDGVGEAVQVVEQAGARAMNELHRMLGLLRDPGAAGAGPSRGCGADGPGSPVLSGPAPPLGTAAEALVIGAGVLDLLFFRIVTASALIPDGASGWGSRWAVPVAGTVLACALLPARRRYPVPVFAAQWVISLASQLTAAYQPHVCLLVALYAVAARAGRGPALTALVACAVPVALNARINAEVPEAWGPTALRFLVSAGVAAAVVGVVWGAGRRAHGKERRAEDARHRHERALAEALASQRHRLARELHDSVTGALTAMILHAGAGRARLTVAEGPVHDALRTVEDRGARATAELHRLVELLRAGDDAPDHGPAAGAPPTAGLGALDELTGQARRDGLRVGTTVDGRSRPLDPSVDHAAYRVVQEALTNARKHAGAGADVRVAVCWRDDELGIEVHSGGGSGAAGVPSSGIGLRGLAERVRLLGGTLAAGPDADVPGGWRVSARLPTAARPS